MTLPRDVTPETLDALPEDDPRAIASRLDLRRVHRAMGSRAILLKALARATAGRPPPRRVLELGAGDGTLMLRAARSLAKAWPGVQLTLLDRQRVVERRTLDAFGRLGWQARTLQADVLDWVAQPVDERWDLAVANLFVHHFRDDTLRALLRGVAARTDAFVACEPRRARLALAASHLVGLIGANAVTRGDAVASVHAGFRGDELRAVWPADGGWRIHEAAAGLFTHCCVATRRTGSPRAH